MTRRNRKRLTLALGAAALIGGLVYFSRRKQQLAGLGMFNKPKYRLVTKRYAPAPLVGSTNSGGMRTEHRRSATMPLEERIASMQKLVYDGVQDPQMRKLALGITHHCPERDGLCESKAIYDYVKNRVRYTGDIAEIRFPSGEIEGIDLFQSGKRTNEFLGGDCDDHAVLSSTLLALNGITPRFRVTAETRNGEDSHVYAISGLPKTAPTRWLALDTTLPGKNNFGVEMPRGRTSDFPA